jgi:Ras-related GTP-binding protein A/B
MRSMIFGNCSSPAECHNLGVTVEIEQSNYSISSGTCLHIWDCGGQDVFVKAYLDNSANASASVAQGQMFAQVQCVVFVFDVASVDFEKEQAYFAQIIGKLNEYSPNAHIFCLLHKMDLIPEAGKEAFQRQRFHRIRNYLLQHGGKDALGRIQFFCTSIWDQSLLKAWSAIISSVIPNLNALQLEVQAVQKEFSHLKVEHIAIFDKSSMLLLVEWPVKTQSALEQLSSIIKQYRKSAVRGAEFEEIAWRNGEHEWHFSTFKREFVFIVKVPLQQENSEGKKQVIQLLERLKSL